MTFERFVYRRGVPRLVYSDNTCQFRLAADQMKAWWNDFIESDWKPFTQFLSSSGITWKFIPELSPWQGGFYERMIGLV